ncbi:MAG: DUF3078 domain-containing protein [Gemmatimonadaceae bacterium]|nr:DUF3078 domain-containing protein [Chitinophagaceae bacterium]
MRKIFLITLLSFSLTAAFAQDGAVREMQKTAERGGAPADTIKDGWRKGGLFSLNLAQGGSRNWAAGAEKFSFSTNAFLNLFANHKRGRYSWDNSLDLSYALVNTTSLGVRKTDDRIDFLSRYGYALNKKFDLSWIANFRSQFTDGFDYDYLGQKGNRRRISGLFAPAYVTIAPGITWKPTNYFSIFVSPFSARWIIVSNAPYSYKYQGGIIPDSVSPGVEKPLANLYGVDAQRKVKFEFGAFASVNFNKEIIKNVYYKSRLDLYSNYLKTDRPGETFQPKKSRAKNVDVFWTNVVNMKVNKWLNVTYNFDLIYDDDVRQFGPTNTSAATQLRSLLGVGFAAKF